MPSSTFPYWEEPSKALRVYVYERSSSHGIDSQDERYTFPQLIAGITWSAEKRWMSLDVCSHLSAVLALNSQKQQKPQIHNPFTLTTACRWTCSKGCFRWQTPLGLDTYWHVSLLQDSRIVGMSYRFTYDALLKNVLIVHILTYLHTHIKNYATRRLMKMHMAQRCGDIRIKRTYILILR